jgi:subtilisin family serine protease
VPLQTFGWIDEGEVHGTACAEIVHEMAPDAELIFAWYDGSDAAMGEAVDWLMSQGVNIISNSTGGVVGPRDGTGWDARLVDQVASQGVLWVNSSGNEALSHYRAVFRDDDGDNIHEFAPGEESLAVHLGRGGFQIILQWEDSWNAAALDYDLYLYDQDGNLVGASEDYQTGQQGQEPVEGLGGSVDASILYATVVDAGANRDVPFDIFVQGADINYTTPDYSVNTPGDAVGSLTVGAVNFWDDSLAFYSSQGPTADGRLKPEISAPTGVSGATYGERGFDGTSSSCPHVAGAAALIWQANPSFSRDQVIDQLLSNALDLGAAGPDTGYGYGRLRLGSPPQSADMPTVTPALGTVGTPGAPLPTPTPMIYATPLPVASAGGGTEFLAAGALLTLCVGGLGCLGTALVFFGLLGLLVRRRRARRRPAPPPPSPYRQPPRPVPPRDRSPERASRPAPPSPPTRSECPECGEPLRPSARFCPNCGRPVG